MRTISNLYPLLISLSARRKFGDLIPISWLHSVLIVSFVIFIYIRSLDGEFLNIDDIRNLSSAVSRNPLISFVDHRYVWFSFRFYRPLFLLQAWLFYQLFGLNFALMQACILGMHALASVIVYQAIKRMTGSDTVGFLVALLYASSYVVGILVAKWVTDTAPLTNLLFAITLLLLVTPSDKIWWYIALLFCMILAPISRENGLIILGGVGLYALYNGYFGDYSFSRVLAILLTCTLAFISYFSLRMLAIDSSEIPSTQDGSPFIITISKVIVRNFVAVFAPLIPTNDLGLSLGNFSFGILHLLLSTFVVLGVIAGWRTMSRKDRATVFLGSTFVVLGSIIPFLNFRYRNLNLAYFGWLILLATFLSRGLPNYSSQTVRRIVYVTLVSVIILSALMVMFRLPNPELVPNIENSQVLCNENVSEDLAIQIANWNGFEVKRILDCRK